MADFREYIEKHYGIDRERKEKKTMLTKNEFLHEMQIRMNKYLGYEKFTSLSQVESAMFNTLTDGVALPPANGADEVLLFHCDSSDEKILDCASIIEYSRVSERDEDGDPLSWEVIGYEIN